MGSSPCGGSNPPFGTKLHLVQLPYIIRSLGTGLVSFYTEEIKVPVKNKSRPVRMVLLENFGAEPLTVNLGRLNCKKLRVLTATERLPNL